MSSFLLLFILLVFGCNVYAADQEHLILTGNFTQGGLAIGKVQPLSVVKFDGEPVSLSDAGDFVIGFDRDEKNTVLLDIDYPDGTRESRTLSISPREYNIQRINGLPPAKVTPQDPEVIKRIEEEAELAAKARNRDDARLDFKETFIWPAHGPITGVYGSQRILNGEPRRPHYGVDVAGPVGTPVYAPASGVITLAHEDMYFSGGTLILDHGHGLSSSFLHLSKLHVETGDTVKQGDKIAEIGATGRVTGAHLDWRMNLFTRRVDPTLLVPPMDYQASN